jgi:hypothetical protein
MKKYILSRRNKEKIEREYENSKINACGIDVCEHEWYRGYGKGIAFVMSLIKESEE